METDVQSGALVQCAFISFNPVDFAVHDVLEAVRPRWPGVRWIIFAVIGNSVLSQTCCDHQTKLVS